MLPVTLPPVSIQAIAAEVEADAAVARVVIDLVEQIVVSPSGIRHAFQIPALRRAGLLQGIDEIGLTLGRSADIAAFQAKDRQRRAWIYEPVSRP
jgi:3-isopropylmalate/(R)-2-methylmalate dehydratase small subunit